MKTYRFLLSDGTGGIVRADNMKKAWVELKSGILYHNDGLPTMPTITEITGPLSSGVRVVFFEAFNSYVA